MRNSSYEERLDALERKVADIQEAINTLEAQAEVTGGKLNTIVGQSNQEIAASITKDFGSTE